MYEYQALVTEVLDGDTVNLMVDLGFDVHLQIKCRLMGLNTPETHTTNDKEKAAGLLVKKFVTNAISGNMVTVKTFKDAQEKFGRYLVDIFETGFIESINKQLISNGYAQPYFGEKKTPWTDEQLDRILESLGSK